MRQYESLQNFPFHRIISSSGYLFFIAFAVDDFQLLINFISGVWFHLVVPFVVAYFVFLVMLLAVVATL